MNQLGARGVQSSGRIGCDSTFGALLTEPFGAILGATMTEAVGLGTGFETRVRGGAGLGRISPETNFGSPLERSFLGEKILGEEVLHFPVFKTCAGLTGRTKLSLVGLPALKTKHLGTD